MIVKINKARLAFPELFTPRKFSESDAGEPAYSATFLLDKNDPQVKVLEEVISKVASDKWGPKTAAIMKELKAKDKTALHDGDSKAQYAGFDGTVYLSARTYVAPKVIDRDRTELVKASGRPYAGCYVNASVDVWAQDNGYGKRINATLRGVQFVADGESFAGSAPATADEFDDVSDIGDML